MYPFVIQTRRKSRDHYKGALGVPSLSSSVSSSSSSSSSRSISPDRNYDPVVTLTSLQHQPTFSYTGSSPKSLRRARPTRGARPHTLNMGFTSSTILTPADFCGGPGARPPTSPCLLGSGSMAADYVSFPELQDGGSDIDVWTDVRVEMLPRRRGSHASELEMERYDEMFVEGVRFQYS